MTKIKYLQCKMVTFTRSCMGPSHEERLSDFYRSSWQRNNSPYPMLVVRLVVFILTFAILGWCVIEAPVEKLCIYLTTWGMLLIFAMAGSGVVVSACTLRNILPGAGVCKPPWYVTIYWIFFNISVSLAVLITLMYWKVIANNKSKYGFEDRHFWLETAMHGFNCLLVFTEFFASRTPVRIINIYQPLLFGLAYAIFSKIYQMVGGTNRNGKPYIYKFLDWSQPQYSLQYTIYAAIGLIFLYAMLWGAALVRDLLSGLCCSSRPPSENTESKVEKEVSLYPIGSDPSRC